jgi:ribulose-bisphosphate carboxylase large chain
MTPEPDGIMTDKDIAAFFADQASLDMESYLSFHYLFECVIDPEEAAANLCQEQSTAQWKRVGVDEDLRDRFGAKVIELNVEAQLERPSYPTPGYEDKKSYRCRVKIAHPHRNFGPKIPNLLTAACGEGAFHSPGIAVIRLVDIDFPRSFLQHFQGPKFGIEGLRDMLGVFDRPIFFGVIKPNIGLSPRPFAELAFQSWLGGLDIAKDDEMLGDVEWSPLRERAELLGQARLESEKITGEKKIYLANITDEVDKLIELHDVAVERGANALMVNGMTTGLSAVRMLRKHAKVPLVAHFDFVAPLTQIGYFGLRSSVITKLQRLAGFDVIIFPGFGGRMKTDAREVMLDVEACFEPLAHIRTSLPVPAGSQWAGTTANLYKKLETVDFGIVPGRAVFQHPMGPKAGAASLRQGWEAVATGQTLAAYAADHVELRLAIEQHSH